mmetsp:Transcript_8746/g.24670  ORF Transcript_8746/g.24670 Transcript_8746/m.24670 type:complete len:200 (+) Transcript_8746:170-769(+)
MRACSSGASSAAWASSSVSPSSSSRAASLSPFWEPSTYLSESAPSPRRVSGPPGSPQGLSLNVSRQLTNSSKLMNPLWSVSTASNIFALASAGRGSRMSCRIMQNSSKLTRLSRSVSWWVKNGASTWHMFLTSSMETALSSDSSRSPVWQSADQCLSRKPAVMPRTVTLPSMMACTVASVMSWATVPSELAASVHCARR